MQFEADNLGDQHRKRLTEHCTLGFDSSDTPADHTEAIDHRRVRVRTHERVRIGDAAAVLLVDVDGASKVFKIHLMDDAGIGRHNRAVAERLLSPLQKDVSLAIALQFEVGIDPERRYTSESIDLH